MLMPIKRLKVSRTLMAVSIAGLIGAGVAVAQQPRPEPERPAAAKAEDAKPLPRKPEVTELGEPPTDFGSGAEAIRTAVEVPAATKGANGQVTLSDITLAQARAVVEAASAKSLEIGTKMDIAVVDAGGNLKAFVRQDGAWLGSIDISIKKAKTARYFDMPTGEIGKLSQPGGPLFGIEHSNDGLITFPGGLPLRGADGTTIVGAIGVSGSTVENDHAVALAGAAAMKPSARADAAPRPESVIDPKPPKADEIPAAARTGPDGRIDDRHPAPPRTLGPAR